MNYFGVVIPKLEIVVVFLAFNHELIMDDNHELIME